MQRGGDVVNLQEHIPGQYIEKVLADMVEAHKYNKQFEEGQRQFNIEAAAADTALAEEQRQFDEQARIERERNRISSESVRTDKEIAIMGEKRQAIDDARDDYIRISPKLAPPQRSAMAKQLKLYDLADEADALGVRVKDSEKAINTAKASGDPGLLRQAMNEHATTINEMSGWAPQYRANLELDLEGYAAQNALMSLKSTLGENQLTKWGVDVNSWNSASPTQARVYLAQFPATMELKAKLENQDYNQLVKAYEIYAGNQASMQELGVTGEQYRIATENIARIGKEIASQSGVSLISKLPKTKTKTKKTTTTAPTPIQTVSVNFEQGSVGLEPRKKYYVEFEDASGLTQKKWLKGSQIEETQKKTGMKIKSYGEALHTFKPAMDIGGKNEGMISPFGAPLLDIGAEITDVNTGKKLKYEGADMSSWHGGKSGQTVKKLRFTDKDGKEIVYDMKALRATKFIKSAQGTKPAGQIIANKNASLLEETQANEMPSSQDSTDAELQDQQDIEDIITNGI